VGAADAVPGVPDGLLGVHCVVCCSVPVPAQDIRAMLWIPICSCNTSSIVFSSLWAKYAWCVHGMPSVLSVPSCT